MSNKGEAPISGTPEQVALVLLDRIMLAEHKFLITPPSQTHSPDRRWILDTYSECLQAAKGERAWKALE